MWGRTVAIAKHEHGAKHAATDGRTRAPWDGAASEGTPPGAEMAVSTTDMTEAPPAPGPTLAAIGLKHGTDKSVQGHAYLDFYERFFAELRTKPISLLEIGVFEGRSLRMWAEYFPNGRIVGVDLDPSAAKHAAERILIEIADQSNVADLVNLGIAYGPFDIVVDDGSHLWDHQITTLQYLYPFVKAGGFFVLEDLHTSYGDGVPHFRGRASLTAAQYLHKLSDLVVGDADRDLAAEGDAFLRSFARLTEFVALHRHTAVLRRKPVAPIPSAQPLLGPDLAGANPTAGTLLVHLSLRGDVGNSAGLRGGERWSALAIQGFSVSLDAPAGAVEYRALLHDNTWTEWVPQGGFVGSRGKSLVLLGFAVRLGAALAERFECIYAGAFVGAPAVVVARDGAPCRGANDEALEAMEIALRPRLPP